MGSSDNQQISAVLPESSQLEMNFDLPSGNRFRRCLENGVFTMLYEHAAPGMELSDDEAAARLHKLEKCALSFKEIPCALALTDRYRFDSARRAVEYARLLDEKHRNSHLIYLSGRNCSPETMQGLLGVARSLKLANLAAVSGDSRSDETFARLRERDFTESVVTLRALKDVPAGEELFPGTTVNPHSYAAPALYGSIFKLVKKFQSGAQFAVTQAGFDLAQLDALRKYLSMRGLHYPLIARLMLLTPEMVEKITADGIPGVTISPDFLSILNKELRFSASQFEAAQYRRLELQIAGCRLLGFSGVQIAGADSPEKMQIISTRAAQSLREFSTLNHWAEEYQYYMARSDMAPGDKQFYLFDKLLTNDGDELPQLTEFDLSPEQRKSSLKERLVRFLFPEADRQPPEERRWLKKLLADCQGCQRCRLPQTQYCCPERCPKGLANGPCGGVKHNGDCEAGDFRCVHWDIWFAAQRRNECGALEDEFISDGNIPR